MQPGVPADDALWAALEVRCGNVPDTSMEEPVGVTERPELSSEHLKREFDSMGLSNA